MLVSWEVGKGVRFPMVEDFITSYHNYSMISVFVIFRPKEFPVIHLSNDIEYGHLCTYLKQKNASSRFL